MDYNRCTVLHQNLGLAKKILTVCKRAKGMTGVNLGKFRGI